LILTTRLQPGLKRSQMRQSTLDQSPSKLGKGRNGGARRFLPRLCTSPTFLLGLSSGVALYWLLSEVILVVFGISRGGGASPPSSLPWPLDPPEAAGYHAIIIPAGGQTPDGPPPHVLARLERALAIYKMSAEPKPFVITTAWGTPHKPCPHDAAGFERHEAGDNARYLLQRGVQATHLLEESVSLETVGNAYFARVMHTDVRGLRKLAIINNHFHMERTRHVFSHVFSVPPLDGQPEAAYALDFVAVEDRLPTDVLEARLAKEATAAPRFAPGSTWYLATPTLRELHDWVHMENTAYASVRLNEERKPLDPELLKSY
jgi:uncharacterized SAM-binding protein YcdF (DUF218 family)